MSDTKTKIPYIKILRILILLAIFVTAGCAKKLKIIDPAISLPENFTASGQNVLAEKWWLSFNDPQLSELIDEAIGSNFTIRSAWDKLTQARQAAIKTGADFLPEVNYSGSATRTKTRIAGKDAYAKNHTAGLTLAYELDLWGRVRSSQQAAVLDAVAAKEDIATAVLTLSAGVAKTWYEFAETREKASILNQQLQANQKVLDLITARFRKGQIGATDVYRQKQLLEATQGKIIQNAQDMILLQHQLSVLLGKSPAAYWSDSPAKLIALPPLPQTGLPTEVIQRRPDVLSRYKAILAADMRTASAIANQYPTLSISSAAESSAIELHNVFDDWLANLAGNITGPLFDAGLRKAEVKRTKAVLSKAINDYSQSVLEALQEIENALSQESYQEQYTENLKKQYELSRQVYERTEQSYVKGQLDYLRVLDALVSQQNLEISELNSRRVLIERRIDLCKAIAGGWDMQRPAPAIMKTVSDTTKADKK